MATGRDIVNEVLLEDKLAQLWPDHRCLYDVSSAAFKNRDMRQQAMEEIGTKLDQNVDWVKNKMRFLRNSYTKARKFTSSGGVHRNRKKRTAWLLERFQFLDPYIATRPTATTLIEAIENALNDNDGLQAAELLSLRDTHITCRELHLKKPEAQCEDWFTAPWDEMVAAHLRCCWALSDGNYVEAYCCHAVVVQVYTRILQSQKDENWGLPILFAMTLDLRVLACRADQQLRRTGQGKMGDTLEKAAEVLMSCFRICASDSRASVDFTKKWGMLNLVNHLFKIYFKISKMHLCKPLIRAIDSLPIRDKFTLSQRVTYRYYVGRKAMFDSDFKTAEEHLSFAFHRCHRLAKQNKRLILVYLLPVKMLLGHMPKASLLKKYSLEEFTDLATAVSKGNLLQLNTALLRNEDFFVKCGIYLILEKLKIITYRNLFKKVAQIMKTHQIPIGAFTVALKMMKVEDVDDDEVECLLANLIFENKIKGYISHQHRKLVVSKQNAFPLISSLSL